MCFDEGVENSGLDSHRSNQFRPKAESKPYQADQPKKQLDEPRRVPYSSYKPNYSSTKPARFNYLDEEQHEQGEQCADKQELDEEQEQDEWQRGEEEEPERDYRQQSFEEDDEQLLAISPYPQRDIQQRPDQGKRVSFKDDRAKPSNTNAPQFKHAPSGLACMKMVMHGECNNERCTYSHDPAVCQKSFEDTLRRFQERAPKVATPGLERKPGGQPSYGSA
jgi:hypothetical protein